MNNHELTVSQEALYDHLDQQGQSTAELIRDTMGLAEVDYAEFTAEAIQKRIDAESKRQEEQDAREWNPSMGNQKNGLHRSAWIQANKDPRQKAINDTNVRALREHMQTLSSVER